MKIKEILLEHKKILFQFLSISKMSFEFIVIVFLLFGIILAVSEWNFSSPNVFSVPQTLHK